MIFLYVFVTQFYTFNNESWLHCSCTTKYLCCVVQSPLLVVLPGKRKRCGTRNVWTGEVWNKGSVDRGSVEQGKCGTGEVWNKGSVEQAVSL